MQNKDFVEEFIKEVRSYQPHLPPSSLLDLVAYEELPFSNSGGRGDHNGKFRLSVLYSLHASFSLDDRAFVRFLLEQEIIYHSRNRGFNESIKLCAFLLFMLAQVEDISVLWQAKMTSGDTMCGLHDQLLVGAGISETIVYLQRAHEHWSEQAKKYIEEGYQFDENELAEYRHETNRYFYRKASSIEEI